MNESSLKSDCSTTLSSDDCGHPKYSHIIYPVEFFVPEITSGQHGCMMHGSEESLDINHNHGREM